jgi:hypothetical protein
VRQRIEQEVGPIRKDLQQEVEQAREPSRQEEQEEQQLMQQAEEQPVQLASTEGPQDVQRLQPGLFRALLHQTRDLVEQQGEQWLHTFFSESVRTTLQQQTEQKLRLSLQTGLEAILGDSARRELQQEAEQTLQPLLQEAFDAIFVGPVRADMQWHGERVIQALLYGDFEAAGQHAEQAFQSSLHATLAVLQHDLEKIVPLLLKVFLEGSAARAWVAPQRESRDHRDRAIRKSGGDGGSITGEHGRGAGDNAAACGEGPLPAARRAR